MTKDVVIVEEIEGASFDHADALRARQLAVIAAFLRSVRRNRDRVGLSVHPGSLLTADRSTRTGRAAKR